MVPLASLVLAACGSGSTRTVTNTRTVTHIKTVTHTTTIHAPARTRPPTTPANTTTDPAAPGANLTPAQQNAVESAQDYLSISPFSKQALIDQLSSSFGDGYDLQDATIAVNSLTVNWKQQAARAAQQYLNLTSFSCNALIEQLSSSAGDKFTREQAEYGARQTGICSPSGNTSGTPSPSTSTTGSVPNQCSPGVSTSHAISCSLASNVFYEYYKAVQRGASTTGLSAWSPATRQYYTVSCSENNGLISCRIGGTTEPDAEVEITSTAIDAYTPQSARDYAATHDVGPNG